MVVVDKRLEELHPYANNPRINDNAVEAVAKSIQDFGWKQPLVIAPNGEIICGHTRYKAAKMLGLNAAPCVIADDLTEAQMRAFRVLDNKLAELSSWDYDLLLSELSTVELTGFDLDFGITGFSDEELALLIADAATPTKENRRQVVVQANTEEELQVLQAMLDEAGYSYSIRL